MATKHQTPRAEGGTVSRYRTLIASIAVFLTLIAALMAFNIFASTQIATNTGRMSAAAEMRTINQNINQNLFNLKLSYGEDPNSPHYAYTINDLTRNRAAFDKGLQALLAGGEATTVGNEAFTVKALTNPTNIQQVQELQKMWQPLGKQIDTYLAEARSPLADSTNLDLAVITAQSNNVNMADSIASLAASLEQDATRQSAMLRIIQLAGIVATIAYFIVFIFYFMRKLRASDNEAVAARNETTEILDTVHSGLFLLDDEMNIGNQYSKELEQLLGQRHVGGQNLLDVLGDKLSDKDLEATNGFINQLYNPRVKERLIGSLNPLSRIPLQITNLKTGERNTRYLDFKFNRIYHGKDISRVLVNVSDETHAVLLEQKIAEEREQNDIQLEMLSTLLNADSTMVNDFVRNTKRHTLEINNILKRPGESQTELREKLNAIFREVHSLKGEASALNLHGFTAQAENLETELRRLQNFSSLSGENFLGLAVSLENLMMLTQTIRDLTNRLSQNPNAPQQTTTTSATPVKDYYTKFADDLAKRNHKLVDLTARGMDGIKEEEIRTLVGEIAVQLLRNAVVHGIETPSERQAKNKLERGHIHMDITDANNEITLTLTDDGAGIDYDAIRRKAVKMGLYTQEDAAQLNRKQLLLLIFDSGFSTLDNNTGDAGRGVGLDIIKKRVAGMGGKINISSVKDAYTRFTFAFPKPGAAPSQQH